MAEVKIAHDDDIIRTEEGLIFNPYNPLNERLHCAKYNLFFQNMVYRLL